MKIGYVCTSYNNSSYTRAAVASLYAGSRPRDVRIVVVDNKSNDQDVVELQALGRDYPEVEVLLNPKNVGYFPGLNIGIRRLRSRWPDIDHVVVGNNDLVFSPAFVESIQYHRDIFDARAVIAPDIVRSDGLHQNPHVMHPIGRIRRFLWDVYYVSYGTAFMLKHVARLTKRFTAREETLVGHGLHSKPGPILLGFGACYILGPIFFRNFDRLYAPTFMMEEEFFLAEQLTSIGQATYYDPRFVVFHHDHATTDLLPSRRHWTICREAHLIYKRYLKMSPIERRAAIARGSQASA
jgi:GT2 family glycosyltransferase